MRRFPLFAIGAVVALLSLAASTARMTWVTGHVYDSNFHHPLDITNQYFPLTAGTTFVYDGTTDRKSTHEEFVVTNEIKTVNGVDTRVIRDTNFENGKVVEATDDWFAQDDAGNVWYFGEFASQIRNGKVIGHQGSWEAGVNGASAGIVMEAHPKVGDTYRQELAPGIAEDMATVLSLTESITVPYGSFAKVLETKDFSPLEPSVVEHKYFAPGVGQIKSVMVEGGSEESHLVNIVTK